MHIKKLEICGFKSFVDKTVVHFDHDVIGIVGPNGCGKSNIVDAIRWCMGEQSAKHLRGKAMEDVIFNGSESRGPAGLAEVTITFDNSDRVEAASLPIEYRDYSELAVTRRLFRDGTSEYLLNKAQVRLRDITELFLGTGVGTKAYSIVEQGRIGQIVSARPEDRRLFIEEAAGITKYKQRRKQAERKMDLTRQNMLRVTDIVNEIDRTRGSLKRQVAKAERFLSYRAEQEDLALHEASHKLLELIAIEKVDQAGFNAARAATAAVEEQLAAADALSVAAREEAGTVERRADDAGRESLEAENAVASLVTEQRRCEDRLAHLGERLRTGQEELELVTVRLERLEEERAELTVQAESLGSAEAERIAEASSEEQQLAALRAEEHAARERHRQLRGEHGTAERQLAGEEARLDALEHRVADAKQRGEKLAEEREQLTLELAAQEAKRTALADGLAHIESEKVRLQERRREIAAELERTERSTHDSRKALEALRGQLSQRQNRLRALEEVHRRLEGIGAGPKALLKQNLPGVLGLVAERVEAPSELTAALAGLLGDRLQVVVVEDPDRGLELLGDLQRKSQGRASVVARRPPFVAGASARSALPDLAGVRGPLLDELRFAAEDDTLVRALVGDAIVVETSAVALELVRRRPTVTAVALDGTVVRPDGVISGGAGDGVAAGLVEQKRELRVLAEDVERLKAEFELQQTAHTALEQQHKALQEARDAARTAAHQGELAALTASKDFATAEATTERVARRLERLATEGAQLDASIEGALGAEEESRQKLEQLAEQVTSLAVELVAAEEALGAIVERVAVQSALVTDRKVRLAQIREQAGSARSSLARVASATQELAGRVGRLRQELLENAAGFGEFAGRYYLALESHGDAARRAEAARSELSEARTQLEQVRAALTSKDEEARRLRAEQSRAEEAARRHELGLQRIELERTHLLQNIREKFRGLELPKVVGDYHRRLPPDAEQRRRLEELGQLIDRMGPVNLDAKAEHDEAERRFVELSQQKKDIEQALDELDRAIKHMDRESRKRFKETFDHVNELFKASFVRLFRGGRGELKLTNPDDLLESGVDIIAMPPGKKLGNIELMSGGEKALTAVALIFAIFQHKPSPFCVLDEVDAPLDEANVSRYNEAIRSMTDRSQFIIITHIKKTMQSVDVLYGVTMGEPGVSRLVSVKVNEHSVQRSGKVETRTPAVGEQAPEAAVA